MPANKDEKIYNFMVLLSYPNWKKFITPDFIKQLSDDDTIKLAYALKDSPKGQLLLANNTEVIDALLEKNPGTVIIITKALQETDAGQALLRKNRFADKLRQADKSGEVRKTLKGFTPIPEDRIKAILETGTRKIPGTVRLNTLNAEYYQR